MSGLCAEAADGGLSCSLCERNDRRRAGEGWAAFFSHLPRISAPPTDPSHGADASPLECDVLISRSLPGRFCQAPKRKACQPQRSDGESRVTCVWLSFVTWHPSAPCKPMVRTCATVPQHVPMSPHHSTCLETPRSHAPALAGVRTYLPMSMSMSMYHVHIGPRSSALHDGYFPISQLAVTRSRRQR